MTFDARENIQSQIPALQILVALGFKPLSQADAELEISDQQREKAWREQSLDSLMAQTKAIITAGMKN